MSILLFGAVWFLIGLFLGLFITAKKKKGNTVEPEVRKKAATILAARPRPLTENEKYLLNLKEQIK